MSVAPARTVDFTPAALALRVGQSVIGPLLSGPTGQVAMKQLASMTRDGATGSVQLLDALDQAAAGQVIKALQKGENLPGYLLDIGAHLQNPDAIQGRTVALVTGLHSRIADTISGLHDVLQDRAQRGRLTQALTTPDQTHMRILKLERDSGETQYFLAYRIQHNHWRGERLWYGGGLRWAPNINPHLVEMLATDMTFKNALMGLHMGGGKGGIAVDPKRLSRGEKERLSQAYAIAFADAVARFRDKPAPDMGTTDAHVPLMRWHQGALDEMVGVGVAPGSYTAKNLDEADARVDLNGIRGRDIATGLGGVVALQALRQAAGATFAIGDTHIVQGAGNAGGHYAILTAEAGEKVVGISDSTQAWYDPNGLSVDFLKALRAHKEGELPFTDLPMRPNMTPDQLLAQWADIMVPAARHNTITTEIVRGFAERGGRVFLPLANKPFQDEAELAVRELELAGRILSPADVLISGGGVTLSEAESYQNAGFVWDGVAGVYQEVDEPRLWTMEESRARLAAAMILAVRATYERAQERGITLTEAAWEVGILRLAESMPG